MHLADEYIIIQQVMCIYFYYRLGRLANGMYSMFDPARYGGIPVLPSNVNGLELQPWQSIALLRILMQMTGRFREAFSLLHSEENIEFTNTQARIDRYNSYLDDCYKYQHSREASQRDETAQGGLHIQQPVWYFIWRARLALVTEFCQAEDVEAAKQHLKKSESILDSALAIFDRHHPELKVDKEALMLRAWDARCQILALSGCTPKILFKAWTSLADGAYKIRNIHHFLIGLEAALNCVDFPKDSPNGLDGHLKLYRQIEKQYLANGNLLDLLCKLMNLSRIGSQAKRGLGDITEMIKDFHARFPQVQCWRAQGLIAKVMLWMNMGSSCDDAAVTFWSEMMQRYHDDEKEFWDEHCVPVPESFSDFPLDQVDNTQLPKNDVLFEKLVLIKPHLWEVLIRCLKADCRAGVLTDKDVRALIGQSEDGSFSFLCPTPDSLRDHFLGPHVTIEKWFLWYQKVKEWLLKPTSWGPEHNRHILLASLLHNRAKASMVLYGSTLCPHEAELYGHQYIHYITEFLYNLYPELCPTARDTYSSIYATIHVSSGIMYSSLALTVRTGTNCNTACDYFAKAKLAYENARREYRRLKHIKQESLALRYLANLYVLSTQKAIPPALRPVSQAAAMDYLYEAQRLHDIYRSNVGRLEMGANSLQLHQGAVNTLDGVVSPAHNIALSILMGSDDEVNPEQCDCAGSLRYQNRDRETQIWEWVQRAKSRVLSEFSLMAPGNTLIAAIQGIVHQTSAVKQAELDSLVRQDIDALQYLRQGNATERVKLRAVYDKVHKRLLEQLGRISKANCIPSTAQDTAAEPTLGSEGLFSIQEAERLAIAAGGPVVLVQWFQYFPCRFPTDGANSSTPYKGDTMPQLAMLTIRVSPNREISSASPELKIFKLRHGPFLVEDWITDNMEYPVGDADGVSAEAKQPTLGLASSNTQLRELDFLVAPLGEVSQRDDTLVFSPAQSLHRIPLHALQFPDGELVIKRNPVVYCQDLTTLRKSYWLNPIKGEERKEHQKRSAPNSASTELEENECLIPFTAAIFNDSPRCSSLGRDCLRVPCPRCSEIIKLGAKFKVPSHTYLAPNARRELFLQTLQTPPSVIHVNLHGVFPEESPNRTHPLQSEDKLEHPKRATNPDYFTGHLIQFPESELTAMDILEHAVSYTRPSYKPFHVSLISCSSGRMQIDSTDNGIGLVGSFFYSGATSVLAALWNIQDEDGMTFATSFYEDADGFLGVGGSGGATVVNLAKAAQRAVLAMVEGDNGRLPPYHWAGFVLHGWWVYDADSDCHLQE